MMNSDETMYPFTPLSGLPAISPTSGETGNSDDDASSETSAWSAAFP